ncbi:MAG TPA: crossover junction endodeoxyribonuclease RuvC [Bryobacteraceae bacterium]|nr:crossover junction endodeoxyribonuclease RuvC [Bryobacteraceae bacterium]
MRVLGVDCGAERTGFGVIDSDGVAHTMIATGVIRTEPKEPFAERLQAIARRLREVIAAHRPDVVAVEEVFHSVNSRSALKLAHVRGVALLTAAEAGLPVGEYSPLEVKTSVVGYGRAEKSQVQMMVRSLLRVNADLGSADAADALAVAICHATRTVAARRIGAAV